MEPDRPPHRRPLRFGLYALGIGLAACQLTATFQPLSDAGVDDTDGGGLSDGALGFCPGGQQQSIQFVLESPDVIVALDRSSAMNAPFGSSTGLDAARQGLGDAVRKYQTVVQFGLIEFPGSTFGCSDPSGCCVDQAPGYPTIKGFAAFESDLSLCDAPTATCADTAQRPTALALDSCQKFFANNESNVSQRYVLLVTDGPPGCANGGPAPSCLDPASRVSMLSNNGVMTAIVGLGHPSQDDCLAQLAQRAGNQFPSPLYAASAAELGTTIDAIMSKIAANACHLDLQLTPVNGSITLTQNGMPLPHSDATGDGWDIDHNFRITLFNKACDTLIAQGRDTLSIRSCSAHPPGH